MLNSIMKFAKKHSGSKIDAFARYHEEFEYMYDSFYSQLNNCKKSIDPACQLSAIPKENAYSSFIKYAVLHKKAF